MSIDHIDKDSAEVVLKILRIYSTRNNSWLPALGDVESHDVNIFWVASVLYLILDRYLSCVPDSDQLDFQRDALRIFHEMISRNGQDFLLKIDSDEPK